MEQKGEMRSFGAVVLASVLLALAGCGEKKKIVRVHAPWAPQMTNPAPQAFTEGPAKTLEEMDDGDVLVAVNGVPFYKWEFGLELARYWWTIKQNQRAKPQELQTEYRRFGRSFLQGRIASQLMIQAARAQGLLTASQIVNRVERGLVRAAKRFEMPPKVLDRNIPGGLNEMRYALEDHFWKEAYLASNVVMREVSPAIMSNIYTQIEAENAQVERTNRLQRATIDRAYARIKAGEDFGKLVDEFGEDTDVEKGKGGYWDSYRTTMDIPREIADNVLVLPEGGVSPVLEDDEGYYVYKLLKKTDLPQPTNMPTVVKHQAYEIGRLWVAKEQYVQMPDGYDLKQSIASQLREEQVKKNLDELMAKATVVYPNGTNFFGKGSFRPKKADRKMSSSERQARKIKRALDKGQDPKKLFKIKKPGEGKAAKKAKKASKPKNVKK